MEGYDQYCCDSVISESMVEGHSIPAMSTTDFLSGLHPQDQYFQYYSFPTTNNTAAGTHMTDIIYGGEMSSTYCRDPQVQGHQQNSTTLDVDVDYQVQDDQEDNDYELLAGLINIHVEKEKEEERPWESAAVSSWEWPRFGGTLESVIDQASCLVPLVINVPDHGVHNHGNEVEDDEAQEYCHMAPQVVTAEMVQSKQYSTCNMEWMTVEDKGERNPCYSAGHNSTSPPPPPPPPSYHSQREAMKITEKRQMQRGKSSTTISSSNKRSKATILHNKSERKRRGKINDRMDTLQKLVPNINKQTNKASMLDQVIEYVKKLQTQNDQMMNMRLGMFDNNNMPVAVHPMMMMHYITTMQAMQQQQHHQQQMSIMAQMGMGMSMNPAGLVMMPTGSVVLPNMRRE